MPLVDRPKPKVPRTKAKVADRRSSRSHSQVAKELKAAGKKKSKAQAADRTQRQGRGELLDTVGCLACHQVGDRGLAGLFGGGDLSAVADKRPADFFARWLADPAAINPAHRMPVFKLSDLDRQDLTLYLATLEQNRKT